MSDFTETTTTPSPYFFESEMHDVFCVMDGAVYLWKAGHFEEAKFSKLQES
jgi:hypothetical protein